MRRSHLALLVPALAFGALAAVRLAGPAAAQEEAPRLVVFELFNDTGIPGG